jgi:hypothetical protein
MKTLTFEPAGMSTNICDIGNHRIRTRLLNNDNKVVYLEINIHQPSYPRFQSKKQKLLNKTAKWFVSHCHEEGCENGSTFRQFEGEKGTEANWENIIQWVNAILNCCYTGGKIDETVRIHDKRADGTQIVFN